MVIAEVLCALRLRRKQRLTVLRVEFLAESYGSNCGLNW